MGGTGSGDGELEQPLTASRHSTSSPGQVHLNVERRDPVR
jgi:hypothetical protein